MRGIGRTRVPVRSRPTQSFLREIGYLEEDGRPEAIAVRQVDDEIAHVPGPQLVVPLSNARFVRVAATRAGGASTTRALRDERHRGRRRHRSDRFLRPGVAPR